MSNINITPSVNSTSVEAEDTSTPSPDNTEVFSALGAMAKMVETQGNTIGSLKKGLDWAKANHHHLSDSIEDRFAKAQDLFDAARHRLDADIDANTRSIEASRKRIEELEATRASKKGLYAAFAAVTVVGAYSAVQARKANRALGALEDKLDSKFDSVLRLTPITAQEAMDVVSAAAEEESNYDL